MREKETSLKKKWDYNNPLHPHPQSTRQLAPATVGEIDEQRRGGPTEERRRAPGYRIPWRGRRPPSLSSGGLEPAALTSPAPRSELRRNFFSFICFLAIMYIFQYNHVFIFHRHMINEINIVCVTEPPKIIPYYRLSRSTWPLSDNKELLSHFRRVKPGKSHTTGSLICAKPTRRRDQSTTSHYMKRVHKFNIITNQVFVHKSKHGSEFKQRKIKLAHDTHGRPSMHITLHHRFPIQAPNHLG
jgi:hypothetical protein